MKRRKHPEEDTVCPCCGHDSTVPWYGRLLALLFFLACAAWFIAALVWGVQVVIWLLTR